jgi:adenosylhomocysteine nucleosidase
MLLLIAALSEEVNGILRAGRYDRVDAPQGFLAYRTTPSPKADTPDIAIMLTGAGRERATKAARWAMEEFKPSAVMSIGFGGGTKDTMQPGDLALGTELYRLDGSPFYWDHEQLGDPLLPDRALLGQARNAVEVAGIDFELGPIINLPTIAKTTGMKEWIGEALEGVAVDMESYMVCEVAADAGVPFVAVRAVVDTAEMDLPDIVAQIDQGPAGGRIIPAIRFLSRHPYSIARLTRLARAAARARRSLTEFFLEFSSELTATGDLETAVAQ